MMPGCTYRYVDTLTGPSGCQSINNEFGIFPSPLPPKRTHTHTHAHAPLFWGSIFTYRVANKILNSFRPCACAYPSGSTSSTSANGDRSLGRSAKKHRALTLRPHPLINTPINVRCCVVPGHATCAFLSSQIQATRHWVEQVRADWSKIR